MLGAFAARERRLVEGDVADQIEGVVVAADLLGQFVEEDALAGELVDDGLLAVGVVPRVEESVQRGVRLADGLARVVLERLGDELAVGVEILDALGGDARLPRRRRSTCGAAGCRRRQRIIRRPPIVATRLVSSRIVSGWLIRRNRRTRPGSARRSAPDRRRSPGSANSAVARLKSMMVKKSLL